MFLVFFALGCGLVALWVDHRFPGLSPQDVTSALRRVLAGVAVAYLLIPVAVDWVALLPPPAVARYAIFAVGFAGVTFALLAALWMIRVVQRMIFGGVS